MPFHPIINSIITISGAEYRICEHPVAKGMPYGQMGRRATVYQVKNGSDSHALKVFTKAFRTEQTEVSAKRIRAYANLPGLQVCSRVVITHQNNGGVVGQYPDLEYAVLMPWVEGQTWQEIMLGHQSLTQEQSLSMARNLVSILANMEQEQIAHCDLSGPNVLVSDVNIALVDVEDLYAPGLVQPAKLPGGSAGYGHKTAANGLWSADADRFAGAVLIAEMLGWCDERLRRIAVGEQFFAPGELQENCDRYQLLSQSLKEKWGEAIFGLFNRTWYSQTLSDCPTLAEWQSSLLALQQRASIGQELSAPLPSGGPVVRWRNMGTESANQQIVSQTAVASLLKTADDLVVQGNLAGALGVLRQAREMASSDELNEVNEKIVKVYEKQNFSAPPSQQVKPVRPPISPSKENIPESMLHAVNDRHQRNEKKWYLALTGFFILGFVVIGLLGSILHPPQSTPTPEQPIVTKPVQDSATKTKVPPTSTRVRSVTSTSSKPQSTFTPTLVKQTSSKLQSCTTSTGEICIYSVAPQSDRLIVTLKFRQKPSTDALPTLTVAGKKFKCKPLSTYPDRLYCDGSSVTGTSELLIYSSGNQLIAAGSFNIPAYMPPSPTRHKSNNPYP